MRPPKDEVYQIWQQHFDDFEAGRRALNRQYKVLKRLNQKYPDVVFVMGLSCHGSKARKVNLNAGKRGRPKVGFEPIGGKGTFHENPHIHIQLGGYYAASMGTEFTEIENKLYQKNADKHEKHVPHNAFMLIKPKHGQFCLNYIERQSTLMRYSDKQKVKAYAADRIKFTHSKHKRARRKRKPMEF